MWSLMLVPIGATIILLMFFRKKITWWEYLSLFGSSFIIILISKLIVTTSMTSDTEYLSEPAYKVTYSGEWDEWIEDECSYDCFCQTDDDGYETCQTCWEDCSYRQYHDASYKLTTKSGKTYYITASEYERIVDKWGGEKLVGYHNGYDKHNDDGIYEAFMPKDNPQKVECIVTSQSYTNKVQAAHSEYSYPEVSESDVKKYALFEYPEIYAKYKQKHILGTGDETQGTAEQNMQALNAELGPSKQCKSFILVFRNQPKEAGIMQENYWKGGNKNEFILTVGVDGQNKISWTHAISWCENENLKKSIENHTKAQGYLNLDETSKFMHSELKQKFERKEFADFNYLTVKPSGKSIMISSIILGVIIAGLCVLFVMNPHDEKLMSDYMKRLRNGDLDY